MIKNWALGLGQNVESTLYINLGRNVELGRIEGKLGRLFIQP